MICMDENISLKEQGVTIITMSGNVNLSRCTGDVSTMSGDIDLIYHGGSSISTMSGDIDIDDSQIGSVSNMSGNISLDTCTVKRVSNMTGEVLLTNCNIGILECTDFYGSNTEIETLILRDINKPKRKWWNPFSWFTTQIQTSGNNSINIQVNGEMYIKNGRTVKKSKRKRIFTCRPDIHVTTVEFDNGRTDNIFRSQKRVNVKNGTWEYGPI